MALHHNARITTDGLVVLYDAADINSYPGSGTSLNNLAPNPLGDTMSLYGDLAYGSISNSVVNLSGAGNSTSQGCILRSTGSIADTLNQSFTSIGWIKRTNTRDAEVLSYRETWQRLAFTIFDTGMGFYQREIAAPNGTNATTVSVTNNLNEWNCFALVKSGSQWSFYKDGQLIQTNTFDMSETISGAGYHVGAAWSDDDYLSNGMNGSVGPVLHYTRPLSDQEILQVYNSHKGRYNA
jgi:hypothetical protein